MLDSESQARLEQSEEELAAAVDIRNRSCALQVASQDQILELEGMGICKDIYISFPTPSIFSSCCFHCSLKLLTLDLCLFLILFILSIPYVLRI